MLPISVPIKSGIGVCGGARVEGGRQAFSSLRTVGSGAVLGVSQFFELLASGSAAGRISHVVPLLRCRNLPWAYPVGAVLLSLSLGVALVWVEGQLFFDWRMIQFVWCHFVWLLLVLLHGFHDRVIEVVRCAVLAFIVMLALVNVGR